MMSTGRKSIAFMSSTQTNTVSAIGATTRLAPWKMPLTWSLTKSTQSSTNACVFDGTPVVALRVTSHMKPKPRTPRNERRDARVSTLIVQKPCSLPTGFT